MGFVGNRDSRAEIRAEREDQQVNSNPETRNRLRNETGADFMLQGSINTIVDAIKNEQVRFYQVDLTLVDLETNRKVWIGQKKVKKTVDESFFRF